MEHAKKMVLIPHENIQQIKNHHHQQQQQKPSSAMMVNSVQTPGTPLSRLDVELSGILNSRTYASERDKWVAYMQVLHRYLRLVDHEKLTSGAMTSFAMGVNASGKKPAALTDEEQMEIETGDVRAGKRMQAQSSVLIVEIKSQLNDTLIVESVPKKFRPKAKFTS